MCTGSGTVENVEEMSYFYWHTRLLEEDGKLHIHRQGSPCRSFFKHISPFTPSFTVFYTFVDQTIALSTSEIFVTPMMAH